MNNDCINILNIIEHINDLNFKVKDNPILNEYKLLKKK